MNCRGLLIVLTLYHLYLRLAGDITYVGLGRKGLWLAGVGDELGSRLADDDVVPGDGSGPDVGEVLLRGWLFLLNNVSCL